MHKLMIDGQKTPSKIKTNTSMCVGLGKNGFVTFKDPVFVIELQY